MGLVLIVGTLLDYLMLMLPPNFGDSAWLASLIKDYVSRGTVPLLGIALLVLGVWLRPECKSEAGGFAEGRFFPVGALEPAVS